MLQLTALRERGQPVGPVAADGFPFLSPTLDHALTYWRGIKGPAAMPRRDDLVPERIVALWPHILMVDVLGDGDYFCASCYGRSVPCDRCGHRIAGTGPARAEHVCGA